jgi:hypothetical protein
MGKRSKFERNERDYYPTPLSAVFPLLPYVQGAEFIEPCAGDGRLVRHLESHGLTCVGAYDIEPQSSDVRREDVFNIKATPQCFITNPPWDRDILHPLIDHLRSQAPTWLLFDADWAYTGQASELMEYCRMMVAVGRVKWIEGSKNTGKDNCAWYLFGKDKMPTVFVGRPKKAKIQAG